MLKVNRNKFLLAMSKAELTSAELHKKANVGRNVISKLMNNDTEIMPKTLGKLARALNIDIEYLIKEE